MFLIYNLLSLSALVVYFPWLLLKKGPEKRFLYVKERLGLSHYRKVDIWIHAVSVGEVIASVPFLKAVRRDFPGYKIAFSTITYTGQKIAKERFSEADRIMYMPWDTGICIKRAVRQLQPKIFITIETELWPLLFKTLNSTGASVIVLNGRLSPESFKGYRRISGFMRKVLSCVDFLYMQGNGDKDRIISLGADEERVRVMGSFKFDMEFHGSDSPTEWLNDIGSKLIVAGSTHKGEEEIIIDSYETAKKNISDLKMIIAPRHPERFTEVEELLRQRKLKFIRRSEINQGSGIRGQGSVETTRRSEGSNQGAADKGEQSADQLLPDIILLDTIGELSQVYSKAAISFVGGSLLPFGGHNILEPAYWGKPVIFGPHMDNFPVASDFLKEGAAIEVKNYVDMASSIEDLLSHPEKSRQMGNKAKNIIKNNTGAVKKALGLLRSILGTA